MATACGQPTSVKCRSTSSSTSSEISSINCGTTYYIHFSGAAPGTNNSISSYALYYRNKTNNGSWAYYTSKSLTSTSGYFSVNISNSYDYDWTVQTRGSAGSSYYSGYGTYYDTIRHKPTNPTSCSFSASLPSPNPSLNAIVHPVLGSSYLASFAESPDGSLNVISNFTGAVGAKYLQVSYGIFEHGQKPMQGSLEVSPSVTAWIEIASTLSPSSACSYPYEREPAGRMIQYRVDAIGYNGAVSSGYYYSKPILFAGCVSTKQSDQWKIGRVSVKPSSAWKDVVQVWTKVNDVWKKSF